MADLTSLYPAPPQQNQGLLTGNPAQLVGTLGELQRIGITAQQAPALGQIPGQELSNLQIANQTAQIQQQDAARKMVWGAFGNALSGIQNPSPDDVHNTSVNLARTMPQIATQYPGIFNSASDMLLNGNIGKNAAVMMNSVMSPEGAASRVAGPPTAGGAPTTQPLGAANVAGAQPVGVPPGFAERAAGGAQIDTQLAGNLANAAEGSPARIGILGNLDNTVDKFASGPGADWTKGWQIVRQSQRTASARMAVRSKFDWRSGGIQQTGDAACPIAISNNRWYGDRFQVCFGL